MRKGIWGGRAHDSDNGLDYLRVINYSILKQNGYKRFDVPVILEYLKNHIKDAIEDDYKGRIDFSLEYSCAVTLVVECLSQYFQTLKYRINDCETGEERRIDEFIFNSGDLVKLAKELQRFLEPKHSAYKSWAESELFDEWQAHIKKLHEQLIRIRGNLAKEVFDELKKIRLEHERAQRLVLTINAQMRKCVNKLNWQGDGDMILDIITQLPSSVTRLTMYEHLFNLMDEEEAEAAKQAEAEAAEQAEAIEKVEADTDMAPPQEGGGASE